MLKTLNFVHERSDSLIASKLSSTDISRHVSQTQNIWGNTERKALFIKFSWEQRLYLIMFPTAGFIEDYSTSISGKMQTLWYQWDHYNSQLTEIYDFMSFGRNKKKKAFSLILWLFSLIHTNEQVAHWGEQLVLPQFCTPERGAECLSAPGFALTGTGRGGCCSVGSGVQDGFRVGSGCHSRDSWSY